MTTTTTASGVSYTETGSTIGIPGLLTTTSYDVTITGPDDQQIAALDGISTGIDLLSLKIAPTGDVVTGSGSVTTLVGIIGGTYVSMPGSTGAINVVADAISANTYYIGGTTDINILVNALSGNTVNIYGGTASFSGNLVAGLLSGSTINIGYGGTYDGSTNLISILTGSTVNFTTGGGTLVLNADSGVLNLIASDTVQGVTLNNYDPSVDTIQLKNTVAQITGYTISGSDSTKTITLYGNDGTEVAAYQTNLANDVTLANGTYNAADSSADNPLRISYVDGNTDIGVCFLPGSMIRTPAGDVAVQDIATGDMVVTFDRGVEQPRRVVWTGMAHTVVRAGLPDDEAGYPVRIVQDAIADGVPYRDMLITPEHSLLMDGMFVPARMLVNGRSIFYDHSITSYDYHHVETERHSVIMADGMLTESYLDTGNRRTFRQQGNVVSIGAGPVRSWATDAAAPLAVAPAVVEPVYRQLEARAQAACHDSRTAQPVLTDDADLHLVADSGAVIRSMRQANGFAIFMIPPGVQAVRILSRTSRPCDTIGPYHDDRRQLGVLIREIRLFEGSAAYPLATHLTDVAPAGWHDEVVISDGKPCRWTSGQADLSLGQRHPTLMGLLCLEVIAGGPFMETTGDRAESDMLRLTA
ncbi:Hint domain-containing protein [Komagataeibacter sp. FNDCF1]|uniref:Hint domain-containing protein n=1 Tax=Komagataeibacter sp. FNDCF1 TaxID=2878681 RepID=UPI001E412F86|nr:Hint domain-containing protein [Komagataeibacter sp. FNDCF1]MCE2564537.1 Hint domain-containing protein [Komagataeibacter sp. FNDCF1]